MNSYLQVKKFMGPEKTEDLLKGWTPMSCKGQVRQIKACLKNQSMLSEDQKKKLAQDKENCPVKALQASTRKNPPQQVPSKPKASPKDQSEGQEKGKGKGKSQVEQALPTELQNPKEEKTAMDNVFNMARTLMEFKNKEEERLSQSFPKK
ncbi:hypothetical protein O181_124605 [Austropuccinia psidii MF-1]|uniref:Uncharacterized protein n=1 Tax=Austropuccinia psidii MF-1 TaxID=1389203 RepID=A0A9Q3KTE4_9BASI|nr:hypothetical protein [Austropuccinia psidii MF-1]